MLILTIEIQIYVPFVHSLKEKRQQVKSIVTKLHNRFRVSAAEIAHQDIHQTIAIGVAAIVPHAAAGDRLREQITAWVEDNCQGEITVVDGAYR